MNNIHNLNPNIIEQLREQRYAECKTGIFTIKLYLINELTNDDEIFYMHAISNTKIRSCNDLVSLFSLFSPHIHAKLYFDLKYMLFNKPTADKVFITPLSPMEPNFLLSYIINNVPSVYDGKNGLNIANKYVTPTSLRLTSKEMLMYYFKKFLSQNIYKTESASPQSVIVTFNDKYVIDGKYTFVKHFIENPTKPVKILNIFYTTSPQVICDFINIQSFRIFNDKYNQEKTVDEHTISDLVKSIFNLDASIDYKNKLKFNFKKLNEMHDNIV